MKQYFVYILTNHSRTLYTGVTNNLMRRIFEHKNGNPSSFTKRYRIFSLVYFDQGLDVQEAIQREKEIKSWTRAKRVALIESVNPYWEDLTEDWD